MQGTIYDNIVVVAKIDPDAYTASTVNTDVIDMSKWTAVMFTVMAGDLGSSATLDFVVKGDTASGGSFTTTITGKSITQLTQAGTDSNKISIVLVTQSEVAEQGFRYIRGAMTIGTATSDAGAVVHGVPAEGSPATSIDLSSVDEVVN